VVILQNNIK